MADVTVKSTININKDYLDELKQLISENRLSSLTEGINNAIAMYLSFERKKRYYQAMAEAGSDDAFIERTMDSQAFFDSTETEIDSKW